ncbi:ATP-dependent DNA helicase DDX11 [Drosophila grimshawi]|uniref:DNA 5'-3' helicase n=1 Tax=Drosophila grimshawi TaxID=7222 RepID=B4JP05_DROGR|nr:ATP-dependent DNA helicase DDX11 [Drosophila grimshawi]EDV92448.1 GH24926 [Drosophila grimshawi]
MYSPRKALPVPAAEDFGFPYTPYTIQEQLMQQLFLVLESKQIGIFESPTGTGKSLTLTCGALTWLRQHEQLVRSELVQRIGQVEAQLRQLQDAGEQASDWITAQSKTRKHREELQQLQRLRDLWQAKEQELLAIKQRSSQRHQPRAARHAGEQLLQAEPELNSDEHTTDVLEEQVQEQQERFRDVQIFYCSRTHAQLAQIVAELRKTPHGKSVRCISLGSRHQLCIHAQVRRISNVALINERCLDMARLKPSCPHKAPNQVQRMRDASLSELMDIEELATQGAACGGCPYYATRSALAQAQLVLLPYPLLLQRSTRQQLGIDLRGAVIIVDEAHNLLDTIAQLHSSELSRDQLQLARQQLAAYKERYARRLSSANLLRINQLIFVVRRLLLALAPPLDEPRLLHTYQLCAEGEFFNIDLHAVLQFCARTRFAQKLQGIGQQQEREPHPNENRPPPTQQLLQRLATQHQQQLSQTQLGGKRKQQMHLPETDEANQKDVKLEEKPLAVASPIRPLLAFLETLTSNAADGRVLLNPKAGTLKYLLLNPAEHFADIISEARALIIAGGTMQPTHELTAQLFAHCPERVVERFYSHVVPPDAVLPFVLPAGPTGTKLCFSYTQRTSFAMLNELRMVLQNLCSVLPAGVVCFLPSYDYLETVYAHLEQSGALQRIGQRKRIFREKAGGGGVEQLLQQYADAISQSAGPAGGGALLLSVVGGKLSEGLNFADDLGRGVIVVGLPYPNRTAPELKERMRHLDDTLGYAAGNEYYENLCMKAVNQCIGRSVRHIRDYACVYLLDERYASERIQKKLPAWIARHIHVASDGFGAVQARTARFFKARSSTDATC